VTPKGVRQAARVKAAQRGRAQANSSSRAANRAA
jgi:hypothetical protein